MTGEKVELARLMDWMSLLTLLCDHPIIFRNKMRQRHEKAHTTAASTKNQYARDRDPDSPAEDIDAAKIGLTNAMMEGQEDLFNEMTQGIDPANSSLSYKTAIVEQIVQHSKRIGDKVLIFSHYLPVLSYLEGLIAKLDPKVSLVRLDGSTPMSSRDGMVKQFNTGKYDVFLISTRAGGLGLNITGANRVILMDFTWNPSWEEQAVGRAYRIGQEKEVFVYHLVTGGTFEQKLHNITLFKKQLSARVVDQRRPQRSAFKPNEMLFPPQEVDKDDLSSFMGMDSVFDEVLKSNTGQEIRSVSTTETLHEEIEETLTGEERKEVEMMIADARLRSTDPEEHKRRRQAEQARLFAAAQQNQAQLLQKALQNQFLQPSVSTQAPAPAPMAAMASTAQPIGVPSASWSAPQYPVSYANAAPSQGLFDFPQRVMGVLRDVRQNGYGFPAIQPPH